MTVPWMERERVVTVRKMSMRQMAGEEGFTLAELLVVIIIMSLLLLAVGSMISSVARSSSASHALVRVQQVGNEALDTMMRRIREAVAIDPGRTTAHSLYFAADLDGDGINVADPVQELLYLEEVQFDLNGGYLRSGYCSYNFGPPVMNNWISGCIGLDFKYWYYDETTGVLTEWNPSEGDSSDNYLKIKRIDVVLNISGKALGSVDVERTFTGSVTLRNSQWRGIF
jgi:prepilin-type N-terminal cleavage/methylation domain-containing protein